MIGILRSIADEAREWRRAFLRSIPGETGCKARNLLYGYHCKHGCRVFNGTIIYFPEKLFLGRNIIIAAYTQMNAAGTIEIGDDTLVGPGCMIWSTNHRFSDPDTPIRNQGYEQRKVVIGHDCWIAARAVILPGVRIGDRSVVAAGSVVTRSCDPESVLAGSPARVIRKRTR